MNALATESATLRVGLRLGLVTHSEIVDWADATIAEMNEPPYPVIELALIGDAHPQDVVGKLLELSGMPSDVAILPGVLGRFAYRLRNDPTLGRTVARGLWSIYVDSGYDVPPNLTPIGCFDDDYALAVDGVYGTEDEVFARLLSFCEAFESAP